MAAPIDISVSQFVAAPAEHVRAVMVDRIEPEGTGSRVTIRNVGQAPGFAPRWLLTVAMRRTLTADLRRLRQVAERAS